MNTLQAGINQLCLGTTSHAAVVVDGVGGVASTPIAGTVLVSATGISSTSLPTATPVPGRIYKDLVPFSYGLYTATSGTTPTFTWVSGYNVASLARSGAGLHLITFAAPATNGANMVVLVNAAVNVGSTQLFYQGSANNNATCNVRLLSSAGALTDPSATITIGFVVYGY